MSKFRIKDLKEFQSTVFGADSFIQYWPHIVTDGVEISQINEFFYIIENGKTVNHTVFFTEEEMKCFEEIKNIPKITKK